MLPVSRVVIPLLVLLLCACSAGSPDADPGPASSGTAEPTPSATDSGTATAGEAPQFDASIQPIGAALRERMRFSHGPDCPLRWADLRYLRVPYVDFDEEEHLGELVVHKDYAEDVIKVFEQLYAAEWPIQQMRLVDDYRGDDNRSMAANNTSAYNCRRVAGTNNWSRHAYGAAIDLNPVQNPYVSGASVVPPAGRRFASLDRSAAAAVPVGAIRTGDVVVDSFSAIGWEWGGDWQSAKDYQHFTALGD